MGNEFQEPVFNEINSEKNRSSRHVIKSADVKNLGDVKVSVEEDNFDGVKLVLKKDKNESVKEIKFICSCGQTKSIFLDYNE